MQQYITNHFIMKSAASRRIMVVTVTSREVSILLWLNEVLILFTNFGEQPSKFHTYDTYFSRGHPFMTLRVGEVLLIAVSGRPWVLLWKSSRSNYTISNCSIYLWFEGGLHMWNVGSFTSRPWKICGPAREWRCWSKLFNTCCRS